MNTINTILAEVVNSYRHALSRVVKRAMAARKAEGGAIGLAPLGFLNARDSRGRGVYIPDPKTYFLVRDAFDLQQQAVPLTEIQRIMHVKGLRTKRNSSLSLRELARTLSCFPEMESAIRRYRE